MADLNLEPIPTPLRLQLKRIRYQVLPAVIFALALAAVAYLWKNHAATPNGLGEVTAVTVRVSAPNDGRLTDGGGTYPRLYDHVDANQPIARFDVSLVITQHEKAEEDLTKLQNDLDAAQKGADEATKAGDKVKGDSYRAQAASLRTAVTEARARFNDLGRKVNDGTVVAPISGTITAVHRYPNEFVKQGQEIFTITQDTGEHIISYVRPGTGVAPKKDMKVLVRNQNSKRQAYSIVQEVGSAVQQVPDQQLVNTKRPEWGYPVRIAMPDPTRLPLRPGEVVVLNFESGK